MNEVKVKELENRVEVLEETVEKLKQQMENYDKEPWKEFIAR